MDLSLLNDFINSWGALFIAINIGIIEVIKGIVPMKYEQYKGRYSPLVAIVLGLIIGFTMFGFTKMGIFVGVITGLSSSGLFSGIKATVNK